MYPNVLFYSTLMLVLVGTAWAQSEPPATLEIDTANVIIYRHDVFDATRVATEAGPTAPLPLRNFMHVTWIGDITAVNGTPVKGTLTVRGTFVNVNPNPAVGIGIADTTNGLASDWIFDILRTDGSPLGTIVASGWAFGARAAGFLSPGQGNLAVVGGTGAFFGVRGQGRETSVTNPQSFASITEDPSIRRVRGGRSSRYTLQLIPQQWPDFVRSGTSPNVFHSDFLPVTAANPARRGEVLIAAAAGLGPTLPGKQPGAPFSADSLQEVVSPVQVAVNGAAVETFNRVGWPGTTGTYRVDFQVPQGTAAGIARIQLIAGWIPGPVAEIPVQ